MTILTEWLPLVSAPELANAEVHVWRAPLTADSSVVQWLHGTLQPDERSRAERFILERDRKRFIAARGILRQLLGAYLQCEPQKLDFMYGPYGKPAISSARLRRPLSFNVSHSHELALIAVASGRELGIDVEKIRPEFAGEEIATRYFSAPEIDELRQLPVAQRAEGFFHCWTRKEAYVKALGEGLRFPLDSFRVSLTPGSPARLQSADCHRWTLRSLAPEHGYVAALVGEGSDWQMRQFSWRFENDASFSQR